jgi:ornithine carbamoyltransferase
MTVNLKGRSFLSLKDFTSEEIRYLLDLSKELKAKRSRGELGTSLKGKSILLLFEKTSSRTRCAFEIGAVEEGGHATFLAPGSSQFGKKESVVDSARLFARYFHGIEYRGFSQKTVEELAEYSGVPVWNGLTDEEHPTQILADMLTIEEHVAKPLSEVKVVFCGDIRNNMSYSWMYGCAKMGMHYVAYGPAELAPTQGVIDAANEIAKDTGAVIEWGSDPSLLAGADVIYTDVWASMGEEDQIPERVRLLTPFKVTEELMAATGNPEVIFLHCLPAFHNFDTDLAKEQMELGYDIREVTDEVFSSPAAKVWGEAENRLHTIKAILVATLGE